jgi:hypothetical protein
MIETETYYRATENRTLSNAAHQNKEPLWQPVKSW